MAACIYCWTIVLLGRFFPTPAMLQSATMTPIQRRTALIRLLAKIDQQIREAESLASDGTLSDDDRRFAAVQLDFRREAVKRVEAMLGKLDSRE